MTKTSDQMAKDSSKGSSGDPALPHKKRARRRLVGAAALGLAAAIGLPMILDSEPKREPGEVKVQIPSRDAPLKSSASNGPILNAPGSGSSNSTTTQAAGVITPGSTADKSGAKSSEKSPEKSSATASADKLSEKSSGDRAAAEVSAVPGSSSDKAGADNAAGQRSGSENSAVEKAATPANDAKSKAERALAEKKAAEKSNAERRAAEKKLAEEKAAEKKAAAAAAAKEAASAKEAKQLAEKAGEKSGAKAGAKSGKPFLLQAGAFSTEKSATDQASRVKAAGLRAYIERVKTADGERVRVRVGPFPTREAAEQARGQLKLSGIDSALIAP